MICRYCGAELPGDALFCGECGRAVLVESLVGASVGAAHEDHAR
ncbi:MAG: zinc-ribbon domain-containing protein, partial [Pseudolysinimonas sp.]